MAKNNIKVIGHHENEAKVPGGAAEHNAKHGGIDTDGRAQTNHSSRGKNAQRAEQSWNNLAEEKCRFSKGQDNVSSAV